MQSFSYFDKREVLQQEYSQPPILPSPHFPVGGKKEKKKEVRRGGGLGEDWEEELGRSKLKGNI